MQLTGFSHVDTLLSSLLLQMQASLGANLIGVYLYGSLVSGDYDDALSDVDLMAALDHDLTEAELDHLRDIHAWIVAALPRWDDRVEVAYISRHALNTFRTESSMIGIINPGNPLHLKSAGMDWLINWYRVREGGITLLGPDPATLIPPITHAEYVDCVRAYLLRWRNYAPTADAHHGSLAYDVLTMCRGLYTVQEGIAVSKIKAAAWVKETFPEWEPLIEQAVEWRSQMHEYDVFPHLPVEQVARFVEFVLDRVAVYPNRS